MAHIYLESHGVKLDVEVTDDSLLSSVEPILPPGWIRSGAFPEDGHLILTGSEEPGYDVIVDSSTISSGLTWEVAVHVLDAQIRAKIAHLAPDYIFVHAGVVAWRDRALVLPAPSFSGKTALVAALVRAGATYYSDEFAVIDSDGWIHPYPRPLSIRAKDARWGEYAAPEGIGGPVGGPAARAGLIVETKYVPGSRWAPEELGRGAAALALLVNAVPTRDRTEATVQVVGRAAEGATLLKGDRGEADEAAPLLLAALSSVATGGAR
jgi:hypothetical protein